MQQESLNNYKFILIIEMVQVPLYFFLILKSNRKDNNGAVCLLQTSPRFGLNWGLVTRNLEFNNCVATWLWLGNRRKSLKREFIT